MVSFAKRRRVFLPGLFLVGMLVIGCSGKDSGRNISSPVQDSASSSSVADVSRASSGTVYPVTVQNYAPSPDGTVWRDKEQTFEEAPSRVLVNIQGTAELLLHLGLGDRIIGVATVSGTPDPEIAEEFSKLRILSENAIGKEVTLGNQPDLVIGRGDFFAEADWGVGSVDELNSYGVKTYIQHTSRPGAVLEDLYRDIEDLGRIFGVPDRAAAFAGELRARQVNIAERAAHDGTRITYAYLYNIQDGIPTAYAGNRSTFLKDALDLMELVNAFSGVEADMIDIETLITVNPGILLGFTYSGGPDMYHAREALYANPSLQDMSAVTDRRTFICEYDEFWSYNYRIFSALEKLGAELYPDRFFSR